MSTRESSVMRDELLSLGVSQISAESSTSPGGYSDTRDCSAGFSGGQVGSQFSLGDNRTIEEIVASLIEHGYIPSFCAACYRKERTGEAFMKLAKPGTIKGKCSLNALVTLKEYLDDFASSAVKESGNRLIDKFRNDLDPKDRKLLGQLLGHVAGGVRDEFI
jgi:2-iminoacetate synthase